MHAPRSPRESGWEKQYRPVMVSKAEGIFQLVFGVGVLSYRSGDAGRREEGRVRSSSATSRMAYRAWLSSSRTCFRFLRQLTT